MIIKKSPAEIDKMAAAGAILLKTKGLPAFKGYRGFPGSICTSPNHMVVHGIPGKFKLRRADILSVDIGVVHDGWVADAGRHMVRMGDDGWAIYSQDGSLAAHFEFTVAITAAGPRILTPWHESKAKAAAG